MYKVIKIDTEPCYAVSTVFKSAVIDDCWAFIKGRLTNGRQSVCWPAITMYVQDSADKFCDFPADVLAIRKIVIRQHETAQEKL